MRTGVRLVIWDLIYTKQAQKDAKKLAASNLRDKAQALLDILRVNPFQNPPPYEKLVGDLEGAYSRRINIRPAAKVRQRFHKADAKRTIEPIIISPFNQSFFIT